jgi:hypothetical protein
VLTLMNPYFMKNKHALPESLQKLISGKVEQVQMANHVKSACYDMLVDILDQTQSQGI